MAQHRSRVPDEGAGLRLDVWVGGLEVVGSRAVAERLIGEGRVLVDGSVRAKSHRLEGGEEVAVDLPPPLSIEPEDVGLTVVHADEHLLVVDKPAGVVTHPAGLHVSGTVAHGVAGLGARGGESDRPGIVHRLDRDTSGLLLVARSERAHSRLQHMIREREVDRRYLALVVGEPRSRSGRIDAPIGRDRTDASRHSLDTDTPREAVTWFEVVELLPGRALLEVRLETGRTHQIRVHLEAIGLPVAGDPVYGVAGDLGLARQFLHAHRLAFRHPLTGEELSLDSPLPADLEDALERARSR